MLMDARSEGGEGNLRRRRHSYELRMTVKRRARDLLSCFSGKRPRSCGKGLGLA
jgi:hypothetical protein